jgi:hypothetical protein
VTKRRTNGGSRGGKTQAKELYVAKNRQEKNQNLPISEKQKHRHGGPPRPPGGRHRKHQKSSRKGINSQPLNPFQFQDHLALESKPRFRIIIRLENATVPREVNPIVHGREKTIG